MSLNVGSAGFLLGVGGSGVRSVAVVSRVMYWSGAIVVDDPGNVFVLFKAASYRTAWWRRYRPRSVRFEGYLFHYVI